MNKRDVLNKMIPADDLHWSGEEDGFTLLNLDEIDDIIRLCKSQDMEEDNILKVIRWCESVRAGQLLAKNVMSGGIRIHSFDGDQPIFVKNEN